MRIMVIDDDRSVRDIIAYGVGKVSVCNTVIGIPDAETAIKNFKPGDFDCLVVDYKLPGMNGIDLIKEIRKSDDKVGIVMVTAVLDHEKASHLCEGLDVYSVVLKPFNNKDLAEKIQDAAELGRMSPEKQAQFEDAIDCSSVRTADLGKQIRAQLQKRESDRRLAL